MEQLKNTTELIGIKDKNIALDNVFQHKTHIELYVRLDYEPKGCPTCGGKQIKYDFQKLSKIPFLCPDNRGFPQPQSNFQNRSPYPCWLQTICL